MSKIKIGRLTTKELLNNPQKAAEILEQIGIQVTFGTPDFSKPQSSGRLGAKKAITKRPKNS